MAKTSTDEQSHKVAGCFWKCRQVRLAQTSLHPLNTGRFWDAREREGHANICHSGGMLVSHSCLIWRLQSSRGEKNKMYPPPSRTCKLFEKIIFLSFYIFFMKKEGKIAFSLPILIQGFKPKKYLILLLWLHLKLTAAPRASGSFWIFTSLSRS